ncbi:hypothetical protein Plhal304r1_c084g0168501 [Plasmopara halstedii]
MVGIRGRLNLSTVMVVFVIEDTEREESDSFSQEPSGFILLCLERYHNVGTTDPPHVFFR